MKTMEKDNVNAAVTAAAPTVGYVTSVANPAHEFYFR